MAAVSPTYLAGYTGVISIDSVVQKFINGTIGHKVGTFDATNATTSGAEFPERTTESLDGSIDVVIVAAGTAPAPLVGSVYAATFYRVGTKGYTCNILITATSEKIDVKGGVIYTLSFVSQGAITIAS